MRIVLSGKEPAYLGILESEDVERAVNDLMQKLADTYGHFYFCWTLIFKGYELEQIVDVAYFQKEGLYARFQQEVTYYDIPVESDESRSRTQEWKFENLNWETYKQPSKINKFMTSRDYETVLNMILEAFYYMEIKKQKTEEINERIESILNSDGGSV